MGDGQQTSFDNLENLLFMVGHKTPKTDQVWARTGMRVQHWVEAAYRSWPPSRDPFHDVVGGSSMMGLPGASKQMMMVCRVCALRGITCGGPPFMLEP